MAHDPFALQRFLDAQAGAWDDVQAELAAGAKRTHWMWFVFPQLAVLGRSGTAKFYGLAGAGEARAFFAHPVLGARLRACCELLLRVQGRTAEQVMGGVDAIKLRSCLTLFEAALSEPPPVFAACLEKFFGGERDPRTLEWLGR